MSIQRVCEYVYAYMCMCVCLYVSTGMCVRLKQVCEHVFAACTLGTATPEDGPAGCQTGQIPPGKLPGQADS